MLMQTTKDVMGANDSALGNVDPKNTSAIAVTVKQSSIPLENIQSNLYQLIEEWAMICAKFVMAKYNDRAIPVDVEGKTVMVQYDKPESEILMSVQIDVGPSSYWSEIAGKDTLDNLFAMGKITDVQYYERMKKLNIIPDIQGLIEDAKKLAEEQKQIAMMQQQMQPQIPMV